MAGPGITGAPAPQGVEARGVFWRRFRRWVFGNPRDVQDVSIFHHLSLVPFLAWVGLGADGLSSSAYGPEEAYRTLGSHTYLALLLALVMAATVLVISRAYGRIIEEFPHGGGGYVVASKLLGERAGVVSGCALLVDYVLTITVSIAAAGDAIFSFLPLDPAWKLYVESAFIVTLIALNIRGVKESVLVLLPIFLLFLVSHVILILGGVIVSLPHAPQVLGEARTGFSQGAATLGFGGLTLLFLHAYSMGGGTYTGIEAVSNGLSMLREPRVQNGKRTMLYMALSLAFTAAGLLLSYLLWEVQHVPGKTMNAVLFERMLGGFPGGHALVIIVLLSEGALLVVAAQAGFLDGPRVLANMATDAWLPRRFAALSERLTTRNGIVIMGLTALAALLYTRGNVQHLVVMYSINVFLTFSLSTFAMLKAWWQRRGKRTEWKPRLALFAGAFCLCAVILCVTVVEKFPEGGWVTLLVTGGLVCLCFSVRSHYRNVGQQLHRLYSSLENITDQPAQPVGPVDPELPTATVLVAGFGGVGIHTVLSVLRLFPGSFKNLVFLSVGVIDSGSFKGEEELSALRVRTDETLKKYIELAAKLGIPATSRHVLGTDVVAEAEQLCLSVAREFPRSTFFLGKVIFKDERWYHRFLHNETAFALQKRLEWNGAPMVILPTRAA